MLSIRRMTADDIPLGVRLKEQAGWNQTEADWRRFLDLEPAGCFVAQWNAKSVGTTTTCTLGRVGWIAMVVVDRAFRRRGIGTALLETALDWLDRRGVDTVRLDATPLGRPVYEKLGFTAEYDLARMEGVVPAGAAPADDLRRDAEAGTRGRIVRPTPQQLDAAGELDQQVTGTERGRLLTRLFEEGPDAWRVSVEGGQVLGYSCWRAGARAMQIGPAVAGGTQTGLALAEVALAACRGGPIFVDVPLDNGAAMAWAETHGLRKQRRFTRMRRGRPVDDRPDHIWASSGPEKG